MPITRTRAFRLCTPAEYEFVRTSFGSELKRHTPTQLRQKVQRARRLRDKYADLAHRQSGEMRGKRQPRGARPSGGNENTIAKADLFGEALDRFETQLAKIESNETEDAARAKTQPVSGAKAPKKTGRRPARARKAKKSVKRDAETGIPASASRASTEASRAARKKAQPVRSGSPKGAGHVRGRARRNQARRDAR